jgi:uncharacterized RDD family membrane protein YckC
MNEQPGATPAPSSSTADVTGPRIVAAIIDIVLLGIVFVILSVLFGDSDSSSGDDGASFELSLTGLPALLFFVLTMAYYAVLESQSGQTLGKRVMKLRVVAIDGQLTLGKALIRTLLRIIDGLPFFYLLGFIVMLVSQRKQRIGDMAAGTIVVRA